LPARERDGEGREPRTLEEVIARMTAHDPERRPASFEELHELLDRVR
jgi:hypothetical protein